MGLACCYSSSTCFPIYLYTSSMRLTKGRRAVLKRLGLDRSTTTQVWVYMCEQGPVGNETTQQNTSSSLKRRSGDDNHANFHVPEQLWMASFGLQRCSSGKSKAVDNVHPVSELHQQGRSQLGRRQALATILLLPVSLTQMPGKLLAEEVKKEDGDKDQSIMAGLLSIFDSEETTKLGKKLPKAYLKSARDVVQTLRASFSEDAGNDAKFRRNADSAKGAIREYVSNWRGAKLVDAEESYQALERALRVLGEFYAKKGPRAVLPEDVRVRVLEDLQMADDAL